MELAGRLAGLAVALLLLATRLSTALRDWAERRLGWAPLRDAACGAAYSAAVWLLLLPLTVYQGFGREHAYGMATHSFGAWFGDQLTALAVGVVAGAPVVAALYAALHRAGAQWWPWGMGVTMDFVMLSVVVAPVWIEPFFNTYRPVPDGPVKTAVRAMAHANGVPVDNVYVFDASRQTMRVSANVSGLFGAAAIRFNDNLVDRKRSRDPRRDGARDRPLRDKPHPEEAGDAGRRGDGGFFGVAVGGAAAAAALRRAGGCGPAWAWPTWRACRCWWPCSAPTCCWPRRCSTPSCARREPRPTCSD